jgi:ABC-type uncharacterized transport system involved in gliding motility auxiliary subunit
MNSEPSSARSSRQSAGRHAIAKLILAAAILLMVNYLGFKYYTHKDLSTSQFYTLSPKTLDVLNKLDAPVNIYTFLDARNFEAADEIDNLLKEYQHVGSKNFSYEKIDPAYDIARASELQKQLHFDGNDHLIIITYKDRTPRFVKEEDLFDINPMTGQVNGFKGEQQITAALIGVIEGKPSKVYFTQGHGEHSIEDSQSVMGYGVVAAALKNDNVEAENLNLAEKGAVPDDAEAVVIAGPSISFSAIEADAIDKYLAKNGKLFILLDPYVVSGLDAVFRKYDVTFDDDLVLYRVMTSDGAQITYPLAVIYQGGFSTHPITAKFAQSNVQLVIKDPARSITLPPAPQQGAPSKTQFLLQTDADAWGWVTKSGIIPSNPQQLTFNKTTDIPGPITVAAVYDGGNTTDPVTNTTKPGTRIVAIGCAKFLENDTLDAVGSNFFTNCVDWLVKKDAILDISPKKPQEYSIDLSPISYRTTVWFAAVIIPGLCLLAGIVTWMSRRK